VVRCEQDKLAVHPVHEGQVAVGLDRNGVVLVGVDRNLQALVRPKPGIVSKNLVESNQSSSAGRHLRDSQPGQPEFRRYDAV